MRNFLLGALAAVVLGGISAVQIEHTIARLAHDSRPAIQAAGEAYRVLHDALVTPTPTPETPSPRGAAAPVSEQVRAVPDAAVPFLNATSQSILGFELTGTYGTAFYLDSNYLVTAAHVVGHSESSLVGISGGTAGIVALDRGSDLALLRIARVSSYPAPHLELGEVRAGESLTVVCHQHWGVLRVPVRYLYTEPHASELGHPGTFRALVLRVTTAQEVVPGCSGGPVVDAAGRAVGVTVAAGQGFAEAVPASTLVAWLHDAWLAPWVEVVP